MSLLAGIDISTKRLDMAIIPIDVDTPQRVTFRTAELPEPKGDDGVRARSIRLAVRDLFLQHDIASAWVEIPIGPPKYRATDSAHLMTGVYWAVMATIPLQVARAGITTLEWRRELGFRGTLEKNAAIDAAATWIAGNVPPRKWTAPPDEHQAEALLVALAGRAITWKHHDGAAA